MDGFSSFFGIEICEIVSRGSNMLERYACLPECPSIPSCADRIASLCLFTFTIKKAKWNFDVEAGQEKRNHLTI